MFPTKRGLCKFMYMYMYIAEALKAQLKLLLTCLALEVSAAVVARYI